MSESFQPVEPDVRPVSRPRPQRSAMPTTIALFALALVFMAAAAIAITRPKADPLLVAGASASAAPARAADPSSKPDKQNKARDHVRGDIHITAISGNEVSLATDDGWKRTVTVTDAATVKKGGQDVPVSALAVGDQVRIAQVRNDDGSYTVTAIVVPTPVTGGEVTAVSDTAMTLRQRGGASQTVTLTGATTVTVGKEAGTTADIVVGSTVVVHGTVDGSTFIAATVNVRLARAAGEVTAKNGDSLTVKQRDGSSVTVHVDGDTTYRVRGKGKAETTLADIAVGDRVEARGSLRADGSLDAKRVEGRKPKVKPSAAPGN